jgi:hypothetical protein
VSTTVLSGLGVRRGVADRLLDHHRAYYRPRAVRPVPPAATRARLAVSAGSLRARPTPGAVLRGVRRVLVLRGVACLVVWVTAGAVDGVCQIGNALVPSTDQHGAVICGTSDAIGSVPGC